MSWTNLLDIIYAEIIVILVLVPPILIFFLWWLIRKTVVVPTLTFAVDKSSLGRGEVLTLSGSLKDGTTPIANKAVSIVIQPPTGDAISLPSITTDAQGNYSTTWTTPTDAVAGIYAAVAGSMGVSGTATFNLMSH